MGIVLHQLLVDLGPQVVLAVLGIYLLWKKLSLPAALIALGFALVIASKVAALTESFHLARTFLVNGSLAAAVVTMDHSRVQGLVAYYGQVLGFWVGAAGLIWQILVRQSKGVQM